MNEEPDNLSKKSRSVSSPVLIWLALFTAIVLGTMILAWAAPTAFEEPLHPLAIFIVGIVGASFLLWLRTGLRWLFRRLNLRRTLMGLALVATLIALFYTEENWRGKRVWDDCKRELEARGATLDWNAYIPPPVPDNQNIFKAPKMQEWFVGKGPNELWQRLNLRPIGDPQRISTNGSPVIVAELTALPADANTDPDKADATFRFDDAAARAEARKLIDHALGPTASGSQGYLFTARRLNQIQPAHVRILSEGTPTANELEARFVRNPNVAAAAWGQRPDRLRVESTGTHSFQISLSLPEGCAAADYLAWSDTLEADFDLIRQALKRPYARMEGDYQHPVAQPIPNFVCIRNLAQTLAQRAQCHGLLGQGDKALQDLTLLHDLSRLLEARPTGRPVTLVAAMINVAVTGLYVDTVADGFRLQAWREPQLAAIQEQLAQTHLMPLVAEALRNEQVSSPRTLETTTRTGLRKIFSFGDATMNFWRNLKDPTSLALALMPRGWVYRNM